MTYVITQSCCNDAACVAVCPAECIHPTPSEPGFGGAEMLHIDAAACIECDACVSVCPVEAIAHDSELEAGEGAFVDLSKAWYRSATAAPSVRALPAPRAAQVRALGAKVAVVGSGPAACYTVEELVARGAGTIEVNVFERLLAPGGLVRYGVAPDHQKTKAIADRFRQMLARPGVTVYLGVEVGADISHRELMAHHDAVIYAVGAPDSKRLGIAGEGLAGSHAATDFVAWYNGHPDHQHHAFDFTGERAVVVGNGNVALDVARILVSDAERLRRSDIATNALEQLSESRIREVVIVGRRGPAQASLTIGELIGLTRVPEVHVYGDPRELAVDAATEELYGHLADEMALYKADLIGRLPTSASGERRINLRFCLSPIEIVGERAVTGIRLRRNRLVLKNGAVAAQATEEEETLDCGLVLGSVGYRARAVPALPFDADREVVPNVAGRVGEPGPDGFAPWPGVYAAGWIKRGPSGVIGTNKHCARETVSALFADLEAGQLVAPVAGADSLEDVLQRVNSLDLTGWLSIDRHERELGRTAGRPRIKLVSPQEMRAAARATQ